MVFSSLPFLFRFLPLVLLCYFITPNQYKNGILFLFSILFYAWGEPVYILLMLFYIIINFLGSIQIYRFRINARKRQAKITLILFITINLLLLSFFKYSNFLTGLLPTKLFQNLEFSAIALPLGISFYTFQIISYLVDVYKGVVDSEINLFHFGTYISMFPQLIAGPIVQYKSIEQDLKKRIITAYDFSKGIQLFFIGLGKKVLLANNMGLLWNEIQYFPIRELPMLTSWLGILAFTFQIYFDFSGYSDMAIGLGRMFGFHFPTNFNYPYIAQSITAFWRRWHISLGSWFREYVYIPLGGNRNGLNKQIINIGIVWFLTGLWHGASWNFILWGVYYGLLLIIEKVLLLKYLEKMPKTFRHMYTMLFIIIGWVFFSIEQLSNIGLYFLAMFGCNHAPILDNQTVYLLYTNGILLLFCAIGSTTLPKKAGNWILEKLAVSPLQKAFWACSFFLLMILLCISCLVDDTYNPFLYFRF